MLARYFVIAVIGLSLIQFAILRSIRTTREPSQAHQALDREASRSFSVLVDLIADSRTGLHGSFSIADVEPIAAPRLEVRDGVASTLVFSQDQYLQDLITHYGEHYQVDPVLIGLIIEQESNYDPLALSPAGAMGLMQLMPDTAWMLGVDDPWDAEQNIEGGVRYFAEQLDKFASIELALAAYNAGPGAVETWGGVPPYPETVEYVNAIMGRYLHERDTRPEYDTIDSAPKG